MTPPLRTPSELRDALDAGLPVADAAREARMVSTALERSHSPRNRLVWLALAVASVALAVVVGWTRAPHQLEVVASTGPIAEGAQLTDSMTPSLDFGEGSRLDLEPQTVATLEAATTAQVQVVLTRGRVEASVTPGRHWTIRAGPYQVRVLGTVFHVSWKAQALGVDVSRGVVEVSGGQLAEPVRVPAGQRLSIGPPNVTLERPTPAARLPPDVAATDAGPPAAPEDLDAGPPAEESAARDEQPPGAAPSKPSWRQLLRRGQSREAVAALGMTPLRTVITSTGGPDLLLLADAYRLAGQPAVATEVLLGVRREAPGTQPAALASFRLGRIAFEAERWDDATAALTDFIRELPRHPLVADARGRRMVALQRAGRLAEAREAASEVLELDPGGAYDALARRVREGP